MNFGVIGAAGYWGPNWTRVLSQLRMLSICCDLDMVKLADVADRLSLEDKEVQLTTEYNDILKSPDIDGVFVVTPPNTHKDMAVAAIEHGKHVFIEKPLALSTDDCEAIKEAANKHRVTVMVGHTFVYHSAIRKFKESLPLIGRLRTLYTVRASFGKYQYCGIMQDLLPHDLSIFRYLCPGDFTDISHYANPSQDNAFFAAKIGDVVCNAFLSWGYPDKTRKLAAIGEDGILEWDLSETHLFLHKKSADEQSDGTFEHRDEGTENIMVYDQSEALLNEAMHFVDSIQNKRAPLSDIDDGIAVVQVLEKCR